MNKPATGMTHPSDTFEKLMIKAVGQRDMSAQEVAHQILSLRLYCSSFQVVTASLDGLHKVHLCDNVIVTTPSLSDLYGRRRILKCNTTSGLLKSNFMNFVSHYIVQRDTTVKQKTQVIVRTFPAYHSSLDSPHYGFFANTSFLNSSHGLTIKAVHGKIMKNLIQLSSHTGECYLRLMR